MKLKPPLMAVLVLGGVQACMAQETVSSSGNCYVSPTASLSWTLGEPITETAASTTNYITQGFQQPVNITVTSVPTTNDLQGNVSAFPNPSTGIVYLQNNDAAKTLQVDLVNMNGKTILTKTVNAQQQFDLSDYADGIYFLRVFNQDKQLVQTLKIDKTK